MGINVRQDIVVSPLLLNRYEKANHLKVRYEFADILLFSELIGKLISRTVKRI
ncbi:Uncharacterised protein [Haemophilus influenzae]|uniref:Uncharacterized protein n=1 Tax=Haemophilus influenzae TaxID=727 RepID=A0A2X1RSU9_HAEIF|nr:Uncharacterised protein [Haemophilus influenzae]